MMERSARKRSILGGISLTALAFFGWLMLQITLEYWPIRSDAAFLQIKQQYLGIRHWELAFWIHVFTSMPALLAGFTQFNPKLLAKCPKLHRYMGRIYVLTVCFVTGPASLVMAFYANGGITSRIAFVILALLWLATTAMGWRKAMQREWSTHREWMLRSYALTLSAITLRAWKYLIVFAFEPPPMDVYRLVAWLGFMPNIIIVEWWIRRGRARKGS